jgi:hypothetical protein
MSETAKENRGLHLRWRWGLVDKRTGEPQEHVSTATKRVSERYMRDAVIARHIHMYVLNAATTEAEALGVDASTITDLPELEVTHCEPDLDQPDKPLNDDNAGIPPAGLVVAAVNPDRFAKPQE